MQYGLGNLKNNDYKVDYIITHQPLESIMQKTSVSNLDFNDFTSYLENINYKVDFQKWYSGHIHLDYIFDRKHVSLYDKWEKVFIEE